MSTSRTWYSDVNYALPTYASQAEISVASLWTLQALLTRQISSPFNGALGTAPASAAWTCEGSSGYSGSPATWTGALDTVNRWGESYLAANILNAATGTNHSWIVLKSPAGIASNGPYYLLLDFNSASRGNATLSYSRTAFTGGSATTAPTSTDSTTFATGAVISNTAVVPYFASITRDTYGSFWFALCGAGQGVATAMGLCSLDDLAVTDTWRVWAAFYWATSGVALSGVQNATVGYNANTLFGRSLAGNVAVATTTKGIGRTADRWSDLTAVPSSGTRHMALPLVVYPATAGYIGYRGKFPDTYVVGSGKALNSVSPSSTSIETIYAGSVLLPFTCPINLS